MKKVDGYTVVFDVDSTDVISRVLIKVMPGESALLKLASLDGLVHCVGIRERLAPEVGYVFNEGACEVPASKAYQKTEEIMLFPQEGCDSWVLGTGNTQVYIPVPGTYQFYLKDETSLGQVKLWAMVLNNKLIPDSVLERYAIDAIECGCTPCPSLAIQGGGFVYVEGDVIDEDATASFDDCDGNIYYCYPEPGAGHTVPINDCEGNVVCYAANQSSCAPTTPPESC